MPEESNKPLPDTVRFVFEKSRHHRSFHADGAWASTTPSGEIQISFFNDLRPTPDFTVHAITEGELGEEVSRELHANDVTRELNVTVVMNKEVIQRTITLLARILEQMEIAEGRQIELPQITDTSKGLLR